MATTRIIPMHLNKGKTLAQCLADRTEYGMNPDKTEGGALISAFACEPETAVRICPVQAGVPGADRPDAGKRRYRVSDTAVL